MEEDEQQSEAGDRGYKPSTTAEGMSVTEEEVYLFDLQGFLVIDDVLGPEELSGIRAVLDDIGVADQLATVDYIHAGFPNDAFNVGNVDRGAGPVDVAMGLTLDWGEPVRALVAHEPLTEYFEVLLGSGYRLDHCYGIFMRKGAGSSTGHSLHNGGTPFDHSQYYLVRDRGMRNGMIVVSYAITDVPPGDGGFCCIPGSHKSSFPLPAAIAAITAETSPVVQVPQRAGSALIFTEALTHGCLPWTAATNRYALLFKYCPGHIQWERDSPLADMSHAWSERQRRALALPYFGARPSTNGASVGTD